MVSELLDWRIALLALFVAQKIASDMCILWQTEQEQDEEKWNEMGLAEFQPVA
jgi:hypothetical protein